MTAAIVVGALVTAGAFLILQRGLLRVIIGFILLSHAVNVLLLAAGGLGRREPPYGVGDPGRTADPLPQAFALTAIVITFGITIYLLGLLRFTESGPDPLRDGREPPRDGRDQPRDSSHGPAATPEHDRGGGR